MTRRVTAFPLSALGRGLFTTWAVESSGSEIEHLHPAFCPTLVFALVSATGGDSCIKSLLAVSDVLRLREEPGAAHLRERRPGTPSSAGDPPAAAGLAGEELLLILGPFSRSLAPQPGHTEAY